MLKIDIDATLFRWGRHAKSRVGTEFPCKCASWVADSPKKHHCIVLTTDDDLIEIDGIIKNLKQYDEQAYYVLLGNYVMRYDEKQLVKDLDISKTTLYRSLTIAKSFVLGAVIAKNLSVCYKLDS
ncbi:antiterminator Q family protein [Actinobacillus vicugnae]|uniref:antiterminator Q family protein n=1 Tax=Actinobacillus vicugnae TaxID=2573093 RepID=UPI00124271A7|nr:antiterminator Q family protein [Actinobacillus vicugnae]